MTSFLYNKNEWDDAYANGEWHYLSQDSSELSRQALIASLFKIHRKPGNYSILELGCGEGALCQFIQENDTYLGVDISTKATDTAKQLHPNRCFQEGSIGSDLFLNKLLTSVETCDYIVLSEVLYYLNQQEMATLCNFLTEATHRWKNPTIIVSICRTDAQNLHHGSYYWSLLFELLNHKASLEIADQRHRWDIRLFQGFRSLKQNLLDPF